MSETQKIPHDTPGGEIEIVAPSGWDFDQTATIAWAWLLSYTREKTKPFKLKRDKMVCEGKINALAIVLANALGMSSFYWEKVASEIVQEESV